MASVHRCPKGQESPKLPSLSSIDSHRGVLRAGLSRQGTFPLAKPSEQTVAPVSAAGILCMRKGVSFSVCRGGLSDLSKSISQVLPEKPMAWDREQEVSASRPRRNSLPCLKVRAGGGLAAGKGLAKILPPRRSKCVSFGDASLQMDLFEAFTPYSKKYGAHPDDFFFDADGRMVLEESFGALAAIHNTKEGDTIECVVDMGVEYRKKPQLAARFDKARTVALGDHVHVEERCGEWVRDSIGWLPLQVKDNAMFEVVVPKEKLRHAKARVPVMTAGGP